MRINKTDRPHCKEIRIQRPVTLQRFQNRTQNIPHACWQTQAHNHNILVKFVKYDDIKDTKKIKSNCLISTFEKYFYGINRSHTILASSQQVLWPDLMLFNICLKIRKIGTFISKSLPFPKNIAKKKKNQIKPRENEK